MTHQHTPVPSDADELLAVLRHRERRAVLEHLRESPGEPTTVEELADALDLDRDGEIVRVSLHHRTLPALAETGAVDYDAHRCVARYRGHGDLEALLDELGDLAPAGF